MNLHEYIKKIKFDNFLALNGDLRELAIVRKVLIELSKLFYRDTTFFLIKEYIYERAEIYNKAFDLNYIDNFAIVCNSYSKIVCEILNSDFSIQADVISPGKDKFRHVDVLITTSLGKKYIVDPLMDLVEFQIGAKTTQFASKEKFSREYAGKLEIENVAFLNEYELYEIDNAIGYITAGYANDSWILLYDEFQNIKNFLTNNKKLANEILGSSYNSKDFNDINILEIKLDIISKNYYFGERVHSNPDLIIYMKMLLSNLLTPEEFQNIKIKSFFVDTNDLISNKLQLFFEDTNIRKRGIVVTCNDKAYVYTYNSNRFIKIDEIEFGKLIDANNIFVKESYPVKLLKVMKDRNVDRNLLHHSEFLRIFNLFEFWTAEKGVDLHDYIVLNENFVEVSYGMQLKFYIENEKLVIYDIQSNQHFEVEYMDEGRKINYHKLF